MFKFKGPHGLAVFILSWGIFNLAGCIPKYVLTQDGRPEWGLQLTWHGHSCFTLRDSTGRTVVIDPFDDTVGYGRLRLRADALLITHSHFDHNAKAAVRPRGRDLDLVESTGTTVVAGRLAVVGLASHHDHAQGQINGDNRIYSFYMGGFRVVHLGDIGQDKLTDRQVATIGPVDVLLIPVGGVTTLGPEQAKRYVDQLRPRFVCPMHFGDIRFFKLSDVRNFTRLFSAHLVKSLENSTIRLQPDKAGHPPEVIIFRPSQQNY